jgi:hypothetical protein
MPKNNSPENNKDIQEISKKGCMITERSIS